MNIKIRNRLKELITRKTGAEKYRPSDDALRELRMSRYRFNKVYRKKDNPTFEEAYHLSKFFDFAVGQLYVVDKGNYQVDKNRLIEKYSKNA